MLKRIIPLFWFLVPFCAYSQRFTFSNAEISFFQDRKITYQRWLDQTGIGKVLQVDLLEVTKNNTSVSLWLSFKTADPDTAIGMWNQLRTDFSAVADRDASDELFLKFIQFMEIPAAQGNIQIYLRQNDGTLNRCFYIFLYDNYGEVKVDAKLLDCKAKSFDVTTPTVRFSKVNKGKTSVIAHNLTTKQVFDGVSKYAHARYVKRLDGRYSRVEDERQFDNQFTFFVEDLSREVLTNEQKSYWCRAMEILGIECNDITRERLEFNLHYYPETGQLHCDLTGKFGSGVYRPRDKGWMDMEPDFESYLKSYTTRLGEDIKKYLEKP
jgi:hypothetical protein